MANVTKGYTFGTTETVTAAKLHQLVDNCSITSIVNGDIDAGAAIVDTKLVQLSTAGKVNGTSLTSLNNIPAGAGVIPAANLPVAGIDIATQAEAEAGIENTKVMTALRVKQEVAVTSNLPTIPINKGGTGQVTAQAAVDALLPSQASASGKFLTSNGSTSSWGTLSVPTQYLNLVSTTNITGATTTGNIAITAGKNYVAYIGMKCTGSNGQYAIDGQNVGADNAMLGSVLYLVNMDGTYWTRFALSIVSSTLITTGSQSATTNFSVTCDQNTTGYVKLYEVIQ